MKAAIIGYGYWGPNLARNINSHPEFELKYICDKNPENLNEAKKKYPNAFLVKDALIPIKDPLIECIIIATNPANHFTLAKESLLNGKHIIVEKPLSLNYSDTLELIELSVKKNLILLTDYIFLYNGAIKMIENVIKAGELGKILYIDATRINLGIFQTDVNVLGDLATHDLSTIFSIINEKPTSISAIGRSHFKQNIENLAYLSLFYDSGLLVHIYCSWVAPVKIRQMIIGGDKKMLIYNDIEPSEKIKIYDSGMEINSIDKDKLLIDYRRGNVFIPKYDTTEPLKLLIDDFYKCIVSGQKNTKNLDISLKVASIIDSALISIKNEGKIIKLD